MTDCKHCMAVKEKKNIVFEDREIVAFLSSEAASVGHVIIIPREHRTILEQMTNEEISKMFVVGNKLSAAEFESFGLGGTNLIINNGIAAGQEVPHVSMHLIPRMQQGDNLKLDWQPKQLSEEDKGIAETKLKDACSNLVIGGTVKKQLIVKEEIVEQVPDDGENYLIKDLERLP